MSSRSRRIDVGAAVTVEEVHAPAVAKRVLIVVVGSVPLCLRPQLVWVHGDSGASNRWGSRGKHRVGLHFAEFGLGVARPPVRKGQGPVASVVNGDRNTVKDSGVAVPCFGCFDDVGR